MKDLDLLQRAEEIGKIIHARFHKLRKKIPEIGDVRGIGAMIGIEFVKEGDPGQPHGKLCAAIIKGCAANGLILLSAGTFKNVIRILSPLVITNEQLEKGLDILESEIKKAIKKQQLNPLQ